MTKAPKNIMVCDTLYLQNELKNEMKFFTF